MCLLFFSQSNLIFFYLKAFVDPSTPSDASPRWSMEVRTVSLIELED